MNNFCKNCLHEKIPFFLKERFNESIQHTFIECPIDDKKVVSCFVRTCLIDWEKFAEYCVEENMINSKEYEVLEKEGLYEQKRRGY